MKPKKNPLVDAEDMKSRTVYVLSGLVLVTAFILCLVEYKKIDFDFIITVCDHANETCPNFYSQNAIRLHRNFFDPSQSKSENNWKELFEKCRDEIKLFCLEFSKEFFS